MKNLVPVQVRSWELNSFENLAQFIAAELLKNLVLIVEGISTFLQALLGIMLTSLCQAL